MSGGPGSPRQLPLTLPITSSTDVIRARQLGIDVAQDMGFGRIDQTRVATAISEICRNVVQHSGSSGELRLELGTHGTRRGLRMVVTDRGRGITDVEAAMQDGFSTSVSSLGAGLPGSKRLMDSFEIVTQVGRGTTVQMVKWLPRRS
mgnify:FL=1